jgi:hypothetical protein
MPGKPSSSAPGSFPYSELSRNEERDILTKARIARFSQYILSEDAWFHTANELIAAMKLLEPSIKKFWDCVNAQFLNQNSNPEPEHSLVNVHMMLAGFAIENLCKGYLAGRISPKERDAVKAGRLPEALRTHNILELVERTGMTLSKIESDLVERIGQAIWRGRYPSPSSHEGISPIRASRFRYSSDQNRFTKITRTCRSESVLP